MVKKDYIRHSVLPQVTKTNKQPWSFQFLKSAKIKLHSVDLFISYRLFESLNYQCSKQSPPRRVQVKSAKSGLDHDVEVFSTFDLLTIWIQTLHCEHGWEIMHLK